MKKFLQIALISLIVSILACTDEWKIERPKIQKLDKSRHHLSGKLNKKTRISGTVNLAPTHLSGNNPRPHVSGRN